MKNLFLIAALALLSLWGAAARATAVYNDDNKPYKLKVTILTASGGKTNERTLEISARNYLTSLCAPSEWACMYEIPGSNVTVSPKVPQLRIRGGKFVRP